jgi:hypothetical protein
MPKVLQKRSKNILKKLKLCLSRASLKQASRQRQKCLGEKKAARGMGRLLTRKL